MRKQCIDETMAEHSAWCRSNSWHTLLRATRHRLGSSGYRYRARQVYFCRAYDDPGFNIDDFSSLSLAGTFEGPHHDIAQHQHCECRLFVQYDSAAAPGGSRARLSGDALAASHFDIYRFK